MTVYELINTLEDIYPGHKVYREDGEEGDLPITQCHLRYLNNNPDNEVVLVLE